MRKKSFQSMSYKIEVFTGIRPTRDLTIANYLGAVKPVVELQNQGFSTMVFVADLHALTDNEPSLVKKYIPEIVADYIALGLDPSKTKIYLQSDLVSEISIFTLLLSRQINVAELLRIPTLKDKLKKKDQPETSNAFLLLYPVMMAADILLNRSQKIPVGEDQMPHLEMVRELARRFNKKYANILPLPEVLQIKSYRILSLKGEGKMSKTNPQGAIFLTDNLKTINRKVRMAETAFEGVMSEKLESHILIAKGLAKTDKERQEIEFLIKEHKNKKRVMGRFKEIFSEIIQNFLKEFQIKRKKIIQNSSYISRVLKEGKLIAKENAKETLEGVQKVFWA